MDIFELLDNRFNLKKQVDELNSMLFDEQIYHFGPYCYYSFGQIFDEVLFREWQYSMGRTPIFDILSELNLLSNRDESPVKKLNTETEIYSSFQLDLNFFAYGSRFQNRLTQDCVLTRKSFFKEITNKLKYIFDKGVIKPIKHPMEDYYMIVPCDEKVQTVAENSDIDTAFLLFEYTSPLIKDNVKEKRRILKLLANKYEPIIKTYIAKSKSGLIYDIFDDLSAIFNNFEIRHANMDSTISKNYKPNLEHYCQKDWIELYDTSFQLILAASMIKEYDENMAKIIDKHKQNL